MSVPLKSSSVGNKSLFTCNRFRVKLVDNIAKIAHTERIPKFEAFVRDTLNLGDQNLNCLNSRILFNAENFVRKLSWSISSNLILKCVPQSKIVKKLLKPFIFGVYSRSRN